MINFMLESSLHGNVPTGKWRAQYGESRLLRSEGGTRSCPRGRPVPTLPQGWSIMDTAAFHHGKDGHEYKGPGTVAKAPLSRERGVACAGTTLRQARVC